MTGQRGANMSYVDGFVIPIQKSKVAAYKKMAEMGKKSWMKHGAVQYFECVADDMKVHPGCGDFKALAKLKGNETVFFSFIIFKSKAHRDAVNKKVMAEMVKMKMPKAMPFDPKKMAYAGFKTIVEG
jgi:alkaline phosphatase